MDLDKLTIQIQSRALTIASDFSRYAENVGEARVFEPPNTSDLTGIIRDQGAYNAKLELFEELFHAVVGRTFSEAAKDENAGATLLRSAANVVCPVCGARPRTHACDEEACEPTT